MSGKSFTRHFHFLKIIEKTFSKYSEYDALIANYNNNNNNNTMTYCFDSKINNL